MKDVEERAEDGTEVAKAHKEGPFIEEVELVPERKTFPSIYSVLPFLSKPCDLSLTEITSI